MKDNQFIAADTYLAEEPGYKVAKDNGLVRLLVAWGRRDARHVPEISLPLVHVGIGGLGINEQDARGSFYEPASIHYANAALLHGVDGGNQLRRGGLNFFHLNSGLLSLAPEHHVAKSKF